MFNDVVKIAKAKIVSDEIGNQEKVVDWENAKEVFCQVSSISRSEFYSAAQAGFQPTLKIKWQITMTMMTRICYSITVGNIVSYAHMLQERPLN